MKVSISNSSEPCLTSTMVVPGGKMLDNLAIALMSKLQNNFSN